MSNSQAPISRGPGRLFVVSAPAGTGKNTLVNRLILEYPVVRESISCTTRQPREGEEDGVHYHFLTDEEFVRRIEAGDFLEHVTLYDYRYGTLRSSVEEQLAKGHHMVLVIDTQGGLRLMEELDATFIFIRPPSLEELHRRLSARRTETEAKVQHRLEEAARELVDGAKYNYQITNDDLDDAYEELRAIFLEEVERHASNRPQGDK